MESKWIEGYEGLYKITEDGKVWSCISNCFRNQSNDGGYLRLQLCNGFYIKNHKVHRLVAKAYIPNPYNKPQVNHIDGNTLNNHFSNLEWVTASENKRHAVTTGLQVYYSRNVLQFTLDGKLVREYDSHDEAVKLLGLKHKALNSALSGRNKTAHGFIWKYKEV